MCAALSPALGQGNLGNPAALTETAPATYKARFDTSKGAFVIEVRRDWAPNGADRFYNLVKNGFYDNVRFFRVISGFMVQFGISGDPKRLGALAHGADPGRSGASRATGAASSPMPWRARTRAPPRCSSISATTAALDKQGFAPFGQVASGMNVVDSLHSGYGEGAPRGQGPDQGRIQQEGNAYLTKSFPQLRLRQEGYASRQ